MKLTPDELTVIRAALQFWIDEMCPHGTEPCTAYLDETIGAAVMDTSAVVSLRRRLQQCRLKHVARPAAVQLQGADELTGADDIATVLM